MQAMMWPKGCSYYFSDFFICDVSVWDLQDLIVASYQKSFNVPLGASSESPLFTSEQKDWDNKSVHEFDF